MANLLMSQSGLGDPDQAGTYRVDNTPRPERQGCIDMDLWYQIAALSVGGVLGVNARYWLGVLINRWAGSQFPWSTFTINITGSFAIGLCTVFLGTLGLRMPTRGWLS